MTARRTPVGVLLVAALTAAGCSSSGSDAAPTRTTTLSPLGTTTGRPSPGCPSGTDHGPGSRPAEQTIRVDGRERRYLLATPRPTDRPAPMVVVLHGFAGDAKSFAALTRLPAKATAAGFVVVMPDAGAPSWAIGASPDEAFVEAAIAEVSAQRCIDRDRVSLAGFSLGAAFAITYTCRHPNQVAALATVAVDFQIGCTRPVPYLAFHGDADPLVPYQEGAQGASLPGVAVRSTENNLADWAELDRCRPGPEISRVGTHVVRRRWRGCAPGTEVVLFSIEHGSHAWPGGDPDLSTVPVTQEVDATAEMLRFFRTHPLAGS